MRTHCITIDLANQGRRQVRARFDGGRMSSDGGALLLQAVDQRIVADPQRLDALLVELFLDSHAAAPEEIVLDVDATDDPLHGRQEGRFFHGYYDCYCYLPLYVTCGPHLLCGRLRRSNRDAADGAVEELQRIVGQIGTQPLYEQLYCARGDMENRIKEQQLDLFAAALLEVLRQRGLAGTELARAQFGTIRALLLKVAAVVRVSVRRVWVSLSSVFPRQELFAHSLSRLRTETPG